MKSSYKLGELITQRREKYDGTDLLICGVSKEGFIPPKQKEGQNYGHCGDWCDFCGH